MIRALEPQQEIAKLELRRILKGGVTEGILILLLPINEVLMLVAVLRGIQRGEVEIHRRRWGSCRRLDSRDGLASALLLVCLGALGNLIEFLEQGGGILGSGKILSGQSHHRGEKKDAAERQAREEEVVDHALVGE